MKPKSRLHQREVAARDSAKAPHSVRVVPRTAAGDRAARPRLLAVGVDRILVTVPDPGTGLGTAALQLDQHRHVQTDVVLRVADESVVHVMYRSAVDARAQPQVLGHDKVLCQERPHRAVLQRNVAHDGPFGQHETAVRNSQEADFRAAVSDVPEV